MAPLWRMLVNLKYRKDFLTIFVGAAFQPRIAFPPAMQIAAGKPLPP